MIVQGLLLLWLSNIGMAHPGSRCAGALVSVRFPPTIGYYPAPWIPPPVGWDFGYWYQTNSSSPNAFMRNLQYSTLPIDPQNPTGPRSDLSSFQLTTNTTVFTSYGVDTPISIPAVYNFSGTGILQGATDFLDVLAWGYDCHGVGYRVSYSSFTALTNTPASIDILSRTKSAPDGVTLKKIQTALVAFSDANVTALAQAIAPALQDSARDGMPPIQ